MTFKEQTFTKLLKTVFDTAAVPSEYELHENAAEVIGDFFNSFKANDERMLPLLTGQELSRAFPSFLRKLTALNIPKDHKDSQTQSTNILDSDEIYSEGFGKVPNIFGTLITTLKKVKEFNGFFLNKEDTDALVATLKQNLAASLETESSNSAVEEQGANPKLSLPGLKHSKHPTQKRTFGKKNFQSVQLLESLVHLDDAILNLSLAESGILRIIAVQSAITSGLV